MRDRQGPGGTSSDFTLACLEPCCTLRQVGPQSPYLCGLSRVPDLAGRGLALGPFRPIIHLQSDSLPLVLPRHKFWVAGRALQQPQGSGVQYGPHIKRVLATGPSGWMHKYLPTVGPKASSLAGLSSPLGPAQDLCLPPPHQERVPAKVLLLCLLPVGPLSSAVKWGTWCPPCPLNSLWRPWAPGPSATGLSVASTVYSEAGQGCTVGPSYVSAQLCTLLVRDVGGQRVDDV